MTRQDKRIATNKRDLESGRIWKIGLGVTGFDIGGNQAYADSQGGYFWIDNDGHRRYFWHDVEEIR